MPERDIQNIRLVGSLVMGIGLVLIVMTTLITAITLAANGIMLAQNFIRSVMTLLLALLMGSTLTAGGSQLQRVRVDSRDGIESLRFVWTGLFVLMVLTGIASIWLAQPLASIALFILLALIMVRGSVIRLTNMP